MNRRNAREIAERITGDQLQKMFDNAKAGVKDWQKISFVNKGLTKGFAWNILAKNFDPTKYHHILAKTNMIREFGEFLPDELKVGSKLRSGPSVHPLHQDPEFENDKS